MWPLGKDRKGLPQFHRRISYKRVTHAATTRQQLFSMIQQSPTNKVPIRSLLQKKQTSNPLARVSMLASKIFLEKASAMQPHRPGDHGQRPFVPGAPLVPPAAPWGGRAGSPAMKLGRSEATVIGIRKSPISLLSDLQWLALKTTQIDIAQVTDLPGRTHLADQSDFWPFRYSQAAGSSPVSPSMPSPRPRDFADVAWMHRFKQDYTYFAGY